MLSRTHFLFPSWPCNLLHFLSVVMENSVMKWQGHRQLSFTRTNSSDDVRKLARSFIPPSQIQDPNVWTRTLFRFAWQGKTRREKTASQTLWILMVMFPPYKSLFSEPRIFSRPLIFARVRLVSPWELRGKKWAFAIKIRRWKRSFSTRILAVFFFASVFCLNFSEIFVLGLCWQVVIRIRDRFRFHIFIFY